MFSLMLVVVAAFVGAGYQSIEVGKDIASLQRDVSSLREEFSEEIAGLRSEISGLKTMNGAVVHN